MALSRVEITSDVFWTCVTHALTTEAEEIMGLLLGDIKETSSGESVARIWFAMPQIRTDRRKDRVEASPEQMVRCAAQAEEYSKQRGVRIRVIGWYHSHPHITVLPSHVDVRTQGSYQQLDEGFVGLIFSTFDEDATSLAQRVQVTAFQSVPAAAQASSTAAQLMSEEGYDASLAQALAASRAEAAQNPGGELVRKEVPLDVIQTEQVFERSDNLFGLMRVMFREEQSAFRRAVSRSCDKNGTIHPLAAIHYGATYQQHMCQLIELVLGPTVQALENYKTQVHLQMQRLKQLEQELKAKLAEKEQNSSASVAEPEIPRPSPRKDGSLPIQSSHLDPQPSLAYTSSFNLGAHLTERPHTMEPSPGHSLSATDEHLTASNSLSSMPEGDSVLGKSSIREMKERLERLKTPPPVNGAESRPPGRFPTSHSIPASGVSTPPGNENSSIASNIRRDEDASGSPFDRPAERMRAAVPLPGHTPREPLQSQSKSMPSAENQRSDVTTFARSMTVEGPQPQSPYAGTANFSTVGNATQYSHAAARLSSGPNDPIDITGFNPAYGYDSEALRQQGVSKGVYDPHLLAGAMDAESVEAMVVAAVNPMMESGAAFVEEVERPDTSESRSQAGDSVAGEEKKRERLRDKIPMARSVIKGVKNLSKLSKGQRGKRAPNENKSYAESELSVMDTSHSSVDRETETTPPESPDRESEALKGGRRIVAPKKDRPEGDVADDKKGRASKKMLGISF